jgi:2-polyprenyl-3-methyl-5-hydroxy-6-metoxy-1,4-benzoquinol methylase
MNVKGIARGVSWQLARRIINFGTIRGPIARVLHLKPGERVLDVACGTGEFAPLVPPGCTYVGIDLDDANLDVARLIYDASHRRYEKLDITKDDVPGGPFDVALFISVLHHLDEESAHRILSRLTTQVRRSVVVADLLQIENHFVQSWLVSHDAGHYPRPLWEQKRILEEHFTIEHCDLFATRSRSACLSLFVCRPRVAIPAQ